VGARGGTSTIIIFRNALDVEDVHVVVIVVLGAAPEDNQAGVLVGQAEGHVTRPGLFLQSKRKDRGKE
jgi:hypothetical protein